ncbi:MAG: hypothetical protein K2N72_00525, partial [Oscillospiraceae bacterium]|nr:hypothetical protein [Oscillospiraceae bacterium]
QEVVPLDGNLQSFAKSSISQTKSHFIYTGNSQSPTNKRISKFIYINTKQPRRGRGTKLVHGMVGDKVTPSAYEREQSPFLGV